jgi:hypothetical protein
MTVVRVNQNAFMEHSIRSSLDWLWLFFRGLLPPEIVLGVHVMYRSQDNSTRYYTHLIQQSTSHQVMVWMTYSLALWSDPEVPKETILHFKAQRCAKQTSQLSIIITW